MLTAKEFKTLLGAWNGTFDRETMTVTKAGKAAWNEFMKTRGVPEPLRDLLWKVSTT